MKSAALLAIGLLGLLVSFYLPLVILIGTDSATISAVAGAIRTYLSDTLFWDSLMVTMQISIAATFCCMVLAIPVAIFIAHCGNALERVLATLVLASFFTSILLRSFVWFVLLGRHGPLADSLRWLSGGSEPGLLFSQFAVVLGITHILLPMAIIILWSRLRVLSHPQSALASQLGGSFSFYLLRVCLPSNARVIGATTLLTFVMAIGFYLTPLLLGGGTGGTTMIGVLIDEQVNRFGNWVNGAALALLLVMVLVAVASTCWAGAHAVKRVIRA